MPKASWYSGTSWLVARLAAELVEPVEFRVLSNFLVNTNLDLTTNYFCGLPMPRALYIFILHERKQIIVCVKAMDRVMVCP